MKFILWKPGTVTTLLAGIVILVGLMARPIGAHVNYGNVRGRVTDAQGAVVSAAEISLTNLGTKIVRTTVSNQ
jgi:hypothetical protein